MLTLKQLAQKIRATYRGKDMPMPGVSIDSRTLKKGEVFVAIKGPRFDGHQFVKQAVDKGAAAIVVDHPCGLSVPEMIVDDTVDALGQMAKVWRAQFQIPVIGITGSCGKTGTKEMLSAILSEVGETLYTKGNFNNAYGLPLTLLQLNESHQYAVIEMGTSAPGEIRHLVELTKPTVAMITNIAACHIEAFGTLDAISREKSEIYVGLGEDGIAIVNADEPYAADWKSRIEKRHRVTFGHNSTADVYTDHITLSPDGAHFELHTPIGVQDCHVPLLGAHVPSNAAAAAAAAMAVGVNINAVVTGLSKVVPVKGRLMPCQLNNGAFLIDDTYNASAKAVENALDLLNSMKGHKIFVMSNMAEMGLDSDHYHRQMGELIKAYEIDQALLTGRQDWLKPTLDAAGKKATYYATHQQLINALKPLIQPDSVVLIKGCRSCHMEVIVDAIKEEPCLAG